MKKILYFFLGLLALLVLGLLALRLWLHEAEPQGTPSPETDAMVQSVYANLNKTAWDSTRWVQWSSRMGFQYVWDKHAQKVKVRWDDQEVMLDLTTLQGTASKSGNAISGEQAAEALQTAYKMFCNDSFWLVAPFKLTDPGTVRTLVTLPDGRKGLKVTYPSGGTTPGDSYVWLLDQQGVPEKWKMWVSILPIGGLEGTWERWVTLPTGAKIASFHVIGGKMESPITNIDAGMGEPKFSAISATPQSKFPTKNDAALPVPVPAWQHSYSVQKNRG